MINFKKVYVKLRLQSWCIKHILIIIFLIGPSVNVGLFLIIYFDHAAWHVGWDLSSPRPEIKAMSPCVAGVLTLDGQGGPYNYFFKITLNMEITFL